MKQCIKCGEIKTLDEFNNSKRNKDGKHSYCRACHKLHYLDNKDRHSRNVKRVRVQYRQDARAVLAEALLTGCVDCGTLDLRVLELDHVRGDKISGVATMIRKGMSLDKIKEEILKCEVRCRNCHAIKTYERLGKTWHDEFMGV